MRNRDIRALEDVIGTMQLVAKSERMLDWQHDRMTSLSRHLNGMPGGGGLPKGLEEAFALLEEAGESLDASVRKYVSELRRAERILNGIESRTMRAFVVMKYVMGAPDAEIRRELNFTEYGLSRARKAVEEAEDMKSVVWRERMMRD